MVIFLGGDRSPGANIHGEGQMSGHGFSGCERTQSVHSLEATQLQTFRRSFYQYYSLYIFLFYRLFKNK